MNPRLPSVRAIDLIKALQRAGFILKPHKSTSHRRLVHPDGRRTIVPVHYSKDLSKGLIRKNLRQVEITPDELIALLQRKDLN